MDRHGQHRLRTGRFSQTGRLYLLTTVTLNRRPLFGDFMFARRVIQQMRLSEQQGRCRSLAWVLMPDHVHWLVELKGGSLAGLMREFKSRSSSALYAAGAARTRIWQRGFHDRALRKEEDVKAAARYIVANPIRAGLVGRVRDYPHWDCVWI